MRLLWCVRQDKTELERKMQTYKHLIWVLIISVVVGSIVLWAVYTPANHQLNNEAKKFLPKSGMQEAITKVKPQDKHSFPLQRGSTHKEPPIPTFIKLPVPSLRGHNRSNQPPKSTSRHDLRADHTSSKTAGYIITQTYGGQMTRAIRNLMLQQCWANALVTPTSTASPLYIVEPFSARSNLLHKPILWDALSQPNPVNVAPRFSDYYDLNFYNEYSIHNHSTPLALWEDFIADAPRDAVVVVTPTSSCSKSSGKGRTNSNGSQPLRTSCMWSKPFQVFVDGLKKFGFSVKRTICVTCDRLSEPISLTDIHNQIYQDRSVSDTTVLINSWRNFAFTSSWLKISGHCKMGEDPTSSKRLIPSKLIVNSTQYYKRNILKSDKVIAVMLRIERFLTLKATGRTEDSVQSCMTKTLDLRYKILSEKSELSSSGTFLTLDIGRFGSGIMQSEGGVKNFGEDSLESIRETVAKTVNEVYSGKYTIETWEDTFVEASGGIEERGYIAMLQRNIATEADCLILMGGGSFQQVAAFQYIKNHPEPSTPCLYTACMHCGWFCTAI